MDEADKYRQLEKVFHYNLLDCVLGLVSKATSQTFDASKRLTKLTANWPLSHVSILSPTNDVGHVSAEAQSIFATKVCSDEIIAKQSNINTHQIGELYGFVLSLGGRGACGEHSDRLPTIDMTPASD